MLLIAGNILQQLEKWDRWMFLQVNNYLENPFFDNLMPILRNPYTWIPLYLFLLLFVTMNFKGRGWWWVVLFLCTVSLTDMVSNQVFKEAFKRLRPCQDPDLFQYVHLLVNRCSGYSFLSSHASNHFGMATFIFITMRRVIKGWTWLFFLWAAAISYAQVYVGVHYPFDVLSGAVLGMLFGVLLGTFFNKRFSFVTFE
jgi:undecaprenyl-diphosphatase